MQIVCATPQAAAQVLGLLYAVEFQLLQDFTILPIAVMTPPFIFTVLSSLTATQLAKIRAVPDTTVSE